MKVLAFNPLHGYHEEVQVVAGSGFLTQRGLIGPKNGFNRVFTTPEDFDPDTIRVLRNGARQHKGEDYAVSESGGIGTGYDTITFGTEFAPLSWETLFADYIVP